MHRRDARMKRTIHSASGTSEDRAQQRVSYAPPAIVVLGKLADLTAGAESSSENAEGDALASV
jgi:hypothetical protein